MFIKNISLRMEIEYEGDKTNNTHNNGYNNGYNYYCDTPKNDWPENIKNIYSICSEYDRNDNEYNEQYELRIKTNQNNRKCPLCREDKLNI